MIRRSFLRPLLFAVLTVRGCVLACGGDKEPPATRNGTPDQVATAVIIIHGVGNQTAGYSKPLQGQLKAEVPSPHFVEVLWSDLGSVLRQAEDPPPAKERQAAEQEWLDDLNAADVRRSPRTPLLRARRRPTSRFATTTPPHAASSARLSATNT